MLFRKAIIWIGFCLAASLHAIDKEDAKASHQGDIFKLAVVLAEAGDGRLKNAVDEIRIRQSKVQKAAGDLFSSAKTLDGHAFLGPKELIGAKKNNLVQRMKDSQQLTNAAEVYHKELNAYEKQVTALFDKDLAPKSFQTDSWEKGLARCRIWQAKAILWADNARVCLEYAMGAVSPRRSIKAAALQKLLEKEASAKKRVITHEIALFNWRTENAVARRDRIMAAGLLLECWQQLFDVKAKLLEKKLSPVRAGQTVNSFLLMDQNNGTAARAHMIVPWRGTLRSNQFRQSMMNPPQLEKGYHEEENKPLYEIEQELTGRLRLLEQWIYADSALEEHSEQRIAISTLDLAKANTSLTQVQSQIEMNRRIVRANYETAQRVVINGFKKPKPGLKTVKIPFVKD